MALNIYGLWLQHGADSDGLWVVRDSWANCVARVAQVDRMIGKAPYFNNPKVRARFYSNDGKWIRDGDLSCPGTFAYTRIQNPFAGQN
jgi:hypothetical protein